MISKSSSALLQFYKEWLAFAESENPYDHDFFEVRCGLCANALWWEDEHDMFLIIRQEMNQQFLQAGFDDTDYPFGGGDRYAQDAATGAAIFNPMRLAWVKARISDVEEQ
jgi:hypothetical protein